MTVLPSGGATPQTPPRRFAASSRSAGLLVAAQAFLGVLDQQVADGQATLPGSRLPNRASMRERMARVEATDSCCPAIWNSSAP